MDKHSDIYRLLIKPLIMVKAVRFFYGLLSVAKSQLHWTVFKQDE